MITLTISRVNLSAINGTSTVTFTAVEAFDGQVRQVDGSIVDGQTHVIRMTLRQLAHHVFSSSPLHAYYLSGVDYRLLSQADVRDLFLGAKMSVDRQRVLAGTELVNEETGEVVVAEHDFFRTDIKSIELSDLNTAKCCGSEISQDLIVKAMLGIQQAEKAYAASQAKADAAN